MDVQELLARIARLHELAEFYTPAFAQPDVAAAWLDILELLGAQDEVDTHIAYQDGQIEMFAAEGWPI